MTDKQETELSKCIKELRHEVNNNLMVIFGYTELMLKNKRSDEYLNNVDTNIDSAIENLKQIKKLIKKL